MYAVIETGGKQYRVEEEDIRQVEKVDVKEGETLEFDKVLLVSKEDELLAGRPYVDCAKVVGSVLEQGKGMKIVVYRYMAKNNYSRNLGHRQPFTNVYIEKIVGTL